MKRINTATPGYVVVYAAVLSALFTGGIIAVDQIMKPRIQRNEDLSDQKAIIEVFALTQVEKLTDEQVAELVASRVRYPGAITDPQSGQEYQLITAYDRDADDPGAELIGYAFPIQGMGFWATIRGFMAVDADIERVVGIAFTAHAETPGLGGRITERQWREQFRGLDVTDPSTGRHVYVGGPQPTGPRDPKHGRYVEAITGATQTSRAVGEFVELDIRRFRRAAVAAGLIAEGAEADTASPAAAEGSTP